MGNSRHRQEYGKIFSARIPTWALGYLVNSDAGGLVVEDAFETKSMKAVDRYRLRANDGDELLRKLERSRVVEGDFILGLVPVIHREDPTFSLFAGTFGVNTGTGTIQLTVRPPVPDEED